MSVSSYSSDSTDYVEPLWVQTIDNCFNKIQNNLLNYISTEHFAFELNFLECHQMGITSRFRRDIMCILGISDIGLKNESQFPIKTKTLEIILKVIESAICAQFNIVYFIFKDKMHTMKSSKTICKQIMIEAVNRIERGSYPSLYDTLCEEYKIYSNSVEKIQNQWRKSILDPSYKLCRNRLSCLIK